MEKNFKEKLRGIVKEEEGDANTSV